MIKELIKRLVFAIVFLGASVIFAHLIINKSPWYSILAIPFCVLLAKGLPILFSETCPKCKSWGYPFMGGTKYTQYNCRKCKNNFWVENKID